MIADVLADSAVSAANLPIPGRLTPDRISIAWERWTCHLSRAVPEWERACGGQQRSSTGLQRRVSSDRIARAGNTERNQNDGRLLSSGRDSFGDPETLILYRALVHNSARTAGRVFLKGLFCGTRGASDSHSQAALLLTVRPGLFDGFIRISTSISVARANCSSFSSENFPSRPRARSEHARLRDSQKCARLHLVQSTLCKDAVHQTRDLRLRQRFLGIWQTDIGEYVAASSSTLSFWTCSFTPLSRSLR